MFGGKSNNTHTILGPDVSAILKFTDSKNENPLKNIERTEVYVTIMQGKFRILHLEILEKN